MKRIIKLRPASTADDINCPDGELIDADFIFNASGAGSSGGSGSDTDPEPPVSSTILTADECIACPDGASFLAMHRPSADISNAIIQLADNSLACISIPSPSDSLAPPLSAQPSPPLSPPEVFSPADFSKKVVKAVGVADWLVILTAGSLLYCRWENGRYLWMGAPPQAPVADFTATSQPLPPYSYSAGEPPTFSVSVEIKEDSDKTVLDWLAGSLSSCRLSTRLAIEEAVRTRLRTFLAAVRAAGLHISPVLAAAAWRLDDTTLWLSTEGRVFPAPGDTLLPNPTLSIVNADCSDGMLYLNLRFSRAPFKISVGQPADIGTHLKEWSGLVAGAELLLSDSLSDINPDDISSPLWLNSATRGFSIGMRPINKEDFAPPAAHYTSFFSSATLPDNIFSIGSRLLATSSSTSCSRIYSTVPSRPYLLNPRHTTLPTDSIFHLTNSLRSVEVSQKGSFPLYAFCADGLRALTPDGDTFADVQLISRHVPRGTSCFAPLPDSVCFISEAGIMKAKGTSVATVSGPSGHRFRPSDRLAYLYKDNLLLLYRPGEEGVMACDLAKGSWQAMDGVVAAHHYLWPDTFVFMPPQGIGRPTVTVKTAPLAASPISPLASATAEKSLIPVKTRPIKLGDPFSLKKLSEIEAVWPDGMQLPLKVYGALKPGKWYFLGLTNCGRMIMRGSGWKFFRVETFLGFTGSSYSIPTLCISYY